MPFFDLPYEQLITYRPERAEPADFAAFWQQTLEAARHHPLAPDFAAYNSGLSTVEVFDVTFSGYGGQRIKAWLLLPRRRSGPLPCVVEYIGYGGGRGYPTDWLLYSAAGYAHFVMDTRGQGSAWLTGDTPDVEDSPGNPQHPGFLTRGILHPHTYYYRRLYTDAVRAVEAARSHPAVDPSRIAVAGISQGGGLTIAVAGLEPTVQAALPDVPFLCHLRRASEQAMAMPYQELEGYLQVHRDKVEVALNTLSYFDGMHFAARAQARALFSVGLMDEICPPSTVFAAYNHYAGPKQIEVYRYNHHDGGGNLQVQKRLRFLAALWG